VVCKTYKHSTLGFYDEAYESTGELGCCQKSYGLQEHGMKLRNKCNFPLMDFGRLEF